VDVVEPAVRGGAEAGLDLDHRAVELVGGDGPRHASAVGVGGGGLDGGGGEGGSSERGNDQSAKHLVPPWLTTGPSATAIPTPSRGATRSYDGRFARPSIRRSSADRSDQRRDIAGMRACGRA